MAAAALLASQSPSHAAPATGATRPGGEAARGPWPPAVAVQANPPAGALPSLVLPPAATTEPAEFAALMRSGDVAMVRGDVLRARGLYERAAALHARSPAAAIAAGKTYDPNALALLNVGAAALADAGKAREWYGRARALGDPSAEALLAALR